MMEHVTTIALSLASPVLLGIFGFLWKLSHKVTSLEKSLEACQRGVKSNREQGQVASSGWRRSGADLVPCEPISYCDLLPARRLHGRHLNRLDVENRPADPEGAQAMIPTLASLSGFLGTIWFMALVAAGGFVAGMMFKKPFLKLVTGGKYDG